MCVSEVTFLLRKFLKSEVHFEKKEQIKFGILKAGKLCLKLSRE